MPPPPSDKGVKTFELAQFNVFTNVKNGEARHWRFISICWRAVGVGGMECVGRTCE